MYATATKASRPAAAVQSDTAAESKAINVVIGSPQQIPLWANRVVPTALSMAPLASALGVQFSLRVNAPDDKYEREADRVAAQVLAAPANPAGSRAPLHIQRFEGQPTKPGDTAPASVDRILASPGRPLGPALQQEMDQRFGHDFSQVRVHSGSAAEQSAQDVSARAYTVGRHIVFGAGQFAPETSAGRRLIAHELTHVVQQSEPNRVRLGRSNEQQSLSPVLLRNGPKRIYRQPIPAPLEMTTEAQVALVFDRLAATSGVQIATEVNIAVLDEVGNWIFGRIDRIVLLPDGTIEGVELKLDATSSKTAGQVRYIPLANEGSLIEITGHAADHLGLPQGTRITMRITIVSSESVAQAMEMLGIEPESLPRVIRRAAGSSRPPSQPSGFESAPESIEEVPRSPRAVRPPSTEPLPGSTAEPGSTPKALGRRVLSYEAPAASAGSSVARGATTAAGVAMPVIGIVDELLVGGDMARIRRILSHRFAPNAEEQDFMRSYGLVWNDETFSYHIMNIGWQLYWLGKWLLNPLVLNPEFDDNEIQNPA